MNKYIIYRKHDRHTEDVVRIFEYTPENWEKAKKLCQNDWCMESGFASNAPGREGHWSDDLSDYEYGWEESYWSSLTIRTLEKL